MNDLKTLAKDAVEISAKTALSCIPVGGALVTNVWDAVKSNSARKRLEEWQDMLEDRLSRIEATLEDIGNNENFTSAIYQATEQAIRTGSRTKREYLANAVANSVSCDFEESVMMMFLDGEEIPQDWCAGMGEGAVVMTPLNEAIAAPGTVEKVAEVEAAIADGSLQIFDTSTFTVGGEELTHAFALDTDGDFTPDSEEAVYDGAFHESVFQSAPYFTVRIDGITELN